MVTATPVFAQVSVGWAANGSVDTHNVYFSTTAGVTVATGTKVTAVPNPFPQTLLVNGTAYYYVVTGENSNGEGPASAEVSATPLATMVPAYPTGAKALPANNSDTIRWTAVAGATSYSIYWATVSPIDLTDPTTYTKINNPTSSYVHALLTNGTKYYYKVAASNANGESKSTAELLATPLAPLAAPAGVVAAAGNARDTVKWTAVTGATSYNVYRGTAPAVTSLTGTKLKDKTSPFIDSLLTNGTPYYYVATSVKNGVESAISSPEVTATPAVPPAAPTAVAAAVGITTAMISWTNVTGATGYNIYFGTSAGVKVATGTKITGVATPYTHVGRTNGTTYYYVVTATQAGVESVISTEVSVTPNLTPVAPTGLTATPANASNTLRWTAVANASLYNLYFGAATGVTTVTGTKIAGVANGYVHTGRTNGTPYFYIVTAVNSAGESPASTEATATPNAPTAAPTGVTGVLGNASSTISWTAVTGATSYNLYRGTSAGVAIAGSTKTAGVTSPTVDAGTNGTAYYYVVTAMKAGVESPLSAEVKVTPQGAPAGVTATAGAAGHIVIAWTPQVGATGYNIYWSTTAGVTTASTKIAGAANPYNQGGLTTATAYFYRVTATNASGESATSAEVTLAAP